MSTSIDQSHKMQVAIEIIAQDNKCIDEFILDDYFFAIIIIDSNVSHLKVGGSNTSAEAIIFNNMKAPNYKILERFKSSMNNIAFGGLKNMQAMESNANF